MGSSVSGMITAEVLSRLDDIAMSCYRPRFGARYFDETFSLHSRWMSLSNIQVLLTRHVIEYANPSLVSVVTLHAVLTRYN